MAALDSWPTDATFSDSTMPPHTATSYELAGRLPSQTFQDIRSASKARRRHRANLEKYYSYRHVNAGQLGKRYHKLPNAVWSVTSRILPSETPVVEMTKRQLYNEAQRYPRPPTYHRRPREYERWPKTCRKDRERRARHHAVQRLDDEVQEAKDPYFMAYVTGHGRERDLDDHVFRRCDVCWPELQAWYVDEEMFDSNGESVGQVEDRWEVQLNDCEGRKFGFAGRKKIGAVFLMSEEDWRIWPDLPWYWEGGRDDGWEFEQDGGDDVSETWSWDDLLSRDDSEISGATGDEWEVLSSASSWSHVSK